MDGELKGIRALPCKGVTVVYGHAASRGLDIKKWSKGRSSDCWSWVCAHIYIGLDTGCVYNLRLTALVLGKRWKSGSSVNVTQEEDGEELYELDEEVDGQVISFGKNGHGKIVQVRCAGGTDRLH
jgi:hypothetical protein